MPLTISDDILDSKTVWNFREQIVDLDLVDLIFSLFIKELERLNLIVNEGKIVDTSFIEVPKQHNKKEENQQIKNGETPNSFNENPHKKAQKDVDAQWTKKNNETFFGYKNHIKIDSKTKIIRKFKVTDASVHDSQVLDNSLDEKNNEMKSMVYEKGVRANPSTEAQKRSNIEKSRARVDIFGFMEMSMNSMYLYCIVFKRTNAIIGLMNLTYNMFRKIQLQNAQ